MRITSVDEFIQFKDNVNNGTNYEGTTVFLDSDLSFAGEAFEPIGDHSNDFRGVFDGQGHAISNLKIASSLDYVGLFGCTEGSTIKNVILDTSCSITSSLIGSSNAYIGGIIGYCYSWIERNGPCTIENSVNMGSVTFKGNIGSSYGLSLILGGIVGHISSSNNDFTMKNCANYGDVTHSGKSNYSYIGGIVGQSGYSYGSSSSKRAYIYNCLNHGTITHSSTTKYLYLGGIVGDTWYTTIENCVSGEKFSLLTKASRGNYIGSIVGEVEYSGTTIKYTYFASDLSGYKKCGDAQYPSSEPNTLSYDSTTFELNGTISIGDYTGNSLIAALNAAAEYYALCDYSHWLLNKENNAVAFTINKNPPFTLNAQVILLPSLANEGSMNFDGWYTDNELTSPFEEFEITRDTELYGKWEENLNNYTITFDTRGGIPMKPITAQCGSTVVLGNATGRDSCEFERWKTEIWRVVPNNFVVPPYNITLYAGWICTRISTAKDLIDIAETVNDKGNTFAGTTIYLDSDIDFGNDLSQKFDPIGENSGIFFSGTFDGQGHSISNLAMSKTKYYVGLFGYTKSATIRNVVIDSSCSFSMYSSGWSSYGKRHIGGVVGLVESVKHGKSLIENSVNLASIIVNSRYSTENYFNVGGIAGQADALYNEIILRNCANYGKIDNLVTENYFYDGGIVGTTKGSHNIAISNCLNRGSIYFVSTRRSFYSHVGGIVGRNENNYCQIENCVSAGHISSSADLKGAIVCSSFSDYISLVRCFWTKETGVDYASSNYRGYVNETHSITVNEQSVRDLSSYAAKRGWNKWLFNKNKGNVTFAMEGNGSNDNNEGFGRGWTVTGSDIVLHMVPVDSVERAFSGWFTDSNFDTAFTDYVVNESQTTLYGKLCSLAVIFDAGKIPVFPKHKGVFYGKKYGELPNPEKTGYLFIGWDSEEGLITGESVVTINETHTVHAAIVINNFTLTFDFKNGTKTSSLVTFNDMIVYPENVTREGYSFVRWNDTVERMPGYDLTISAIWKKNGLPSRVIVLITVPCAVVIVVVVTVLLFVFCRKKEKRIDPNLRTPINQLSEYPEEAS